MTTPEDVADQTAQRTELVAVRISTVPPAQFAGTILTARPLAIAVRFAGSPTFTPGETLLLLSGALGARFMTRGVWVRSQGDVAAFQLTGAFQPFDARKTQRVPTDLAAEVRSVIGNSRQRGTVMDVSTNGMAVAVPVKPGGRALEVVVTSSGFSAALPCETVGVSPQEDYTILHLRFSELAASQQAFVRQLITAARAALDPYLEREAS